MKTAELTEQARDELTTTLERAGLRSTRQREQVYGVILGCRDHPTAEEVFGRTRERMPAISLATVYNCLETLTHCGLVRAVNCERNPTRYCPNLRPHAHFHCKDSGEVADIDLCADLMARLRGILPEGFEAESVEINFHGRRLQPDARSLEETSINQQPHQSQ